MARPVTKAGSLFATLVTMSLLLSCEDSNVPIAYLELGAEGRIDSLEVWVKQYLDDGGAVVTHLEPLPISTERAGYAGSDRGSPLRLSIDFPEPGRYAIHLVGSPVLGEILPGGPPAREGDVLVDTRCLTVDGELIDRGGVLTTLRREHDDDRDTFAASQSWCDDRSARGVPCDERCATTEFSALLDCNPDAELPIGPACGELPSDAEFHPFAIDMCADCFDQDCYSGDAPCQDRDGDGYPLGDDCDDDDPAIHPGAEELCGNGIDDNCTVDASGCGDGDLPCDGDGDGHRAQTSPTCGDDCDDDQPEINPRRLEGCGMDPADPEACPGCEDLIDNDCDGRIDEGCISLDDDIDDDGVTFDLDCDDCNSAIGLGRPELCGNGIDEDCDGADLPCATEDRDRDGFSDAELGGSDCDDTDQRTFPGAPDRCGDGVAQNCAGDVDCALIDDADDDRFDATADCDDSSASVNPWAVELCDPEGIDEDCDGALNEVADDESGLFGCGYNSLEETWYRIDFSSDTNHCGGCRQFCCRGLTYCAGTHCIGGSCVCQGRSGCEGDVTDYCCDDGCKDLGTDRMNCGGCGNRCAREEVCRPNAELFGLGECFCEHVGEPCPSGEWTACCPSGCVDILDDRTNCGRCGNDCLSSRRGDICALDGEGEPTCFCGRVGVECGGDAWCTEVTEPEGRACGCADLNNDPVNCGSCGNTCSSNEACTEGSCGCFTTEGVRDRCSSDEVCCAGFGCTDLDSNEDNCGDCGVRCSMGEVCIDGACACSGDDACDDGNRCTTDLCSGGRCVHRTLDVDDDGYCAPGCSDSEPLTEPGECNDAPGDCDDSDAAVNPAGTETCATSDDDDCDGDDNDIDAEGCIERYRDNDRDGYYPVGAPSECRCNPSGTYTSTTRGDCNDSNGDIHPDMRETCSTSGDDNCDGDDNDLDARGCTTRYRDSDRDGYYPPRAPSECRCNSVGNITATRGGDCNDSNRDVNPDERENCRTGYDDDCDGATNQRDAIGCTTYYHDGDNDGYGSAATQCWCSPQGNYRPTEGDDCNDGRADMNPGEDELCNGLDDDCDTETLDGLDECATRCCDDACQECCDHHQCPGPDICDIGGTWRCLEIPIE